MEYGELALASTPAILQIANMSLIMPSSGRVGHKKSANMTSACLTISHASTDC